MPNKFKFYHDLKNYKMFSTIKKQTYEPKKFKFYMGSENYKMFHSHSIFENPKSKIFKENKYNVQTQKIKSISKYNKFDEQANATIQAQQQYLQINKQIYTSNKSVTNLAKVSSVVFNISNFIIYCIISVIILFMIMVIFLDMVIDIVKFIKNYNAKR